MNESKIAKWVAATPLTSARTRILEYEGQIYENDLKLLAIAELYHITEKRKQTLITAATNLQVNYHQTLYGNLKNLWDKSCKCHDGKFCLSKLYFDWMKLVYPPSSF
jgi:hypothetical protein